MIEHATCTCCAPGRPVHRDAPTTGNEPEWAHDDDEIFADVYHVHVSTSGSDCDGQLDRYHTYQIASLNWPYIFAGEPEREPDAHSLWVRLVETSVPCFAESATIHISPGLMTWSEQTDEGHRGGCLQACTDPGCAYDDDSQRDYAAEAAGY